MAKESQSEPPKAAQTEADFNFNPAGDFTDEAPPGADAGAGTPGGSPILAGGGPAVVKFVDEIDLRAILSDIEKLKAEISALKEVKFNADARIKELSESIGELRSAGLQREQGSREIEAKVTKIDEIVKNVQPQIILTELAKRQRELEGTRAQLERTTIMLNETITQVREIQKGMERVRGITNILDVDRGLNAKIGKLESQLALGERFSTKAEKLYYEMDKRMTDFNVMREKLERIDALTREMMKEFDEKKIKLGSAASVDEFNLFKSEIDGRIKSIRSELEKKTISASTRDLPTFSERNRMSAPELEIKIDKPYTKEAERREMAGGLSKDLLKQRDEIKAMLSLLEEEYREGEITENAFEEARKNSEQKLSEIEKIISEGASLPATPATIIPKKSSESALPFPAPSARQGDIADSPKINPEKELPKSETPVEIVASQERNGHPPERHKIPDEKGPEELERLIEIISNLPTLHSQEKDLEKMLGILSRQYKAGVISEETYYDIKRKSEEKLEEIHSKLSAIETLNEEQKLFREEIKRIRKNKGELVSLLSLLDKQKGEGLISEESYLSARANASRKLGEIDKRIELLEKIVEKHINSPKKAGAKKAGKGAKEK